MKNILFIAYQFPPFGGSHSTRTLAIANELAKQHNVYVITVKIDKNLEIYDNQLESKIDENISVINADLGILHRNYYKSRKPKGDNFKKNEKKHFSIKNLKKYKEIFLIPDPVIDWFPSAISKIDKEIDMINPDVILSSATPYTCHLIGYKISRKYNKPLILDYGDPWVYEQSRKRGRIRFKIEKFIESKILKYASSIYVTTETTKKLYEEKYNQDPEKIKVISMGYYKEDFKKIVKFENNKDKINIIYGGTLNPIHRNPEPFFKAIASLDENIRSKFNIEIYCNDLRYETKLKTLKIDNIVKFKGFISHKSFMDKLSKSDILLLFGNSNSLQVPGKVFNYIGSLSKIYLINNVENYKADPTFNIINNSGENIFSINEESEIKKELEVIFELWENGKLIKNDKAKALKYTWENVLLTMMNDIKEIKIKNKSYI